MSKHRDLGDPANLHVAAYIMATDPALDADNNVTPGKFWVDTSDDPVFTLLKRNAGNTAWDVVAGGQKLEIQHEGVALTSRSALDFIGPNVNVTDDVSNDRLVINIFGGTGSSSGGFDNPMTTGGDMIVGAPASFLANVALTTLGATATATSTDVTSDPSKGIDNDNATAWIAGVANTHQTYTIDLGIARSISHFRLLQNGPNTGFRANNYTIQSSPDNAAWTTRKTMAGQNTSPDSGQVALDTSANVRYWRIDANPTGIDQWTIHALELFSADEGAALRLPGANSVGDVLTWTDEGPDWATPVAGGGGSGGSSTTNKALTSLGATATASSTYSIGVGSDPNFGFDGNDATWWASESGTNVAGEWLRVDLGTTFTIAQFRIYQQWQTDFGASSSKIQSSTDGTTWTDRHTLGTFSDTGLLDLASGPISARYWRILGVAGPAGAGNYWRINSLELHIASAVGGVDLSGFSWKQAVRVATTANGTLATAYENGDTVDGVTLATGDRILLKNQTTSSENGIYTVNATGAPTRATDFDAAAEVAGAIVAVREGTANANTAWQMTTDGAITIDTTGLTWAQFGAGGGTTTTSWKDSVRAASTANVTLASAVENGDTLDGVTLATGDRILLKNQTTASENGIYTVNASGAPTRAIDADSGIELLGTAVIVTEGTTNADTAWLLTTNGPITVGTTGLTFVQFGAGGGGSLTVREVDGSPSVAATTIEFPNGTLTDQGSGVARYTPAGGGGTDVAQYMGIQMEAPPSTGWSWINQGTASTSRVGNAELITAPSAGAVNACRLRTRAVPTAPYVLSGLISPTAKKAGAVAWGLFVRESSSGKFMAVRMAYNANGLLQVVKFTNASTVSSAPVNEAVGTWPEGTLWYRIEDDSTNLKFSVSTDGRGWRLLYTEARTTFLTGGADEAGFLADPDNGDVIVSLLAWSIQNPLPAVG
jgi:hypothetical protein